LDFPELFELGIVSEFVRQSDVGHEVKGKGWLIDMLHGFSNLLTVCDIEDESIFEGAQEWIRKLDRTYKRGQKIKKQDGKGLSEEADRWQDLIYKELCARPCIEFQKGALNQKALVLTSEGKPSRVFDKKVWKDLPEIAKSDFSDAAKCLLVEASTPATMVALRGMEAVVREYYTLKTKKAPQKKNLGTIINELHKMAEVNKKLLGYLDYIRSEKRNIAQHPDRIFTQREAERIFMEIVNATHDIYGEITRSKAE
jgi:hypothetical protein